MRQKYLMVTLTLKMLATFINDLKDFLSSAMKV